MAGSYTSQTFSQLSWLDTHAYLYCKLYFDSVYSREIQCKACLHCCLHSYLYFKDLSWFLHEMHSPISVMFPSIRKKARTGTCQPALVQVEKQVTDFFPIPKSVSIPEGTLVIIKALLNCQHLCRWVEGWCFQWCSPSSDGDPRRRIHRLHSGSDLSLHQPLLSKLPLHFRFLYF